MRVASVNEGAALPRSAKTGVAASEKPCRLRIVLRNSRRKAGNFRSEASSCGAAFGARLAGRAGVGEEAGDVGALARERAQDRVGVAGQLGQPVALGGEDAEEAVDVAQDRVGALDQATSMSSPRPARPAPSSLKISRKRCA